MFDRTFEIGLAAGLGEQISDYLLSGKRCEGEGRYEFPRRARHHNLHREAILLEAAHQFRGFVCRYPAGDAKRDAHRRFRGVLLTPLVAVLVYFRIRAWIKFVFDQAVVDLFTGHARVFQRARIFHQRRRACH